MNLATLVSSLVLAASTATAGLLVAPNPLSASPQGEGGSSIDLGLVCLGACDGGDANATAGNETAPPSGNETAPPPQEEDPTPLHEAPAEPARTCGVSIEDGRQVDGPTTMEWSWEVGSATRNLSVEMMADGAWMPFGGGFHARLTDGDGKTVASADSDGVGFPFSYSVISYQGDAATGLSRGLWHLTVEADGILGSVWLDVHSEC